ncbi:MAG: ribonuclease Z [Paramuribaculum sp.]|nr:ribonuclease Z [Paramuribaculum sp.]
MADFTLHILGCGSATPTMRHRPSCQVIDYRGRLMMIDCGEGTQVGMRQCGLKFSRLTDIFISHLHGDHVLGLPGLLSTMALHDKRGSVTIHTFADGIKVLKPFVDYFCRDNPYEIIYNPITPDNRVILDTGAISVRTFPLYHRIPCTGFIFQEAPKPRHLKGDMLEFFKVPIAQRNLIKYGADYVTPDGEVIANDRLTTPAAPSRSYAYCSDTMYDPRVVEAVRGVTTLFHEATYDDSLAATARERGHSTALQAAKAALEAQAQRLVIGHYSKRYPTPEVLLEEARTVFPNTVAANEGMSLDLSDPTAVPQY